MLGNGGRAGRMLGRRDSGECVNVDAGGCGGAVRGSESVEEGQRRRLGRARRTHHLVDDQVHAALSNPLVLHTNVPSRFHINLGVSLGPRRLDRLEPSSSPPRRVLRQPPQVGAVRALELVAVAQLAADARTTRRLRAVAPDPARLACGRERGVRVSSRPCEAQGGEDAQARQARPFWSAGPRLLLHFLPVVEVEVEVEVVGHFLSGGGRAGGAGGGGGRTAAEVEASVLP